MVSNSASLQAGTGPGRPGMRTPPDLTASFDEHVDVDEQVLG
jgi:hypothetical protein